MHVDSDIGFSKEYEDIQKHCLKDVKAAHDHSSHPDNKCKNRYLNIVACKTSFIFSNKQVPNLKEARVGIGPHPQKAAKRWRIVLIV